MKTLWCFWSYPDSTQVSLFQQMLQITFIAFFNRKMCAQVVASTIAHMKRRVIKIYTLQLTAKKKRKIHLHNNLEINDF